jgi:hypothetical protein
MKRFAIFILFTLILFSCCGIHTEVTYSHKGTIVKRIDECGETTFYYGAKKDLGKIWVKYSGINDGFSGYLIFGENGKVLLLSSDGNFQSQINDTTKFEYRRIERPNQKPELNKSVYFVMLSTRYEKERNSETQSEVIAQY